MGSSIAAWQKQSRGWDVLCKGKGLVTCCLAGQGPVVREAEDVPWASCVCAWWLTGRAMRGAEARLQAISVSWLQAGKQLSEQVEAT